MDIEQLTRSQTVLLTLLISFVTSIATGIVTVTLLDQAPPAITQTINRVVERTVERVVPDKTQSAAAATVVTTEKTVVVKEEDLITDAIQKNSRRLVRVYQPPVVGSGEVKGSFQGLGIIVTRDGVVAVDATGIARGTTYRVQMADGNLFTAEVAQKRIGSDIALLAITVPPLKDGEEAPTFQPVAFAAPDSLKLGQTVLSLAGETRTIVGTGIISSVVTREATDTTPASTTLVQTTVGSPYAISGSPALSIFGEVIGFSTADSRIAGGTGSYTPVDDIRAELGALLKSLEPKEGDTATAG